MQWPVLASNEVGWHRKAAQQVDALEIGADLQFLRARFRRARGADANYPARIWAKAAVRTIEETRWRAGLFAALSRDFGSADALVGFASGAGWVVLPSAKWVGQVAELPPFRRSSIPEWKRTIKQMIREQMPAFHLRPEWSNQRNAAAESSRNSAGEIQNAILDDIVAALVTLAPEESC